MPSKSTAIVDNLPGVRAIFVRALTKLTFPQPTTPAQWRELFAEVQEVITLLTEE